MTATIAPVRRGFDPDDLLWLREQFGGYHLELDPWGNVVVSPGSDPHQRGLTRLIKTLVLQLESTSAEVHAEGPLWRIRGGSGYTNVPDLVVLPDARIGRPADHPWHLDPAPLLVAEIASPSTRVIDRTRKRDDYLAGGAAFYLLVDLPGLAPVERPTLELLRGEVGAWVPAGSGPRLRFTVAGRDVSLDARDLVQR